MDRLLLVSPAGINSTERGASHTTRLPQPTWYLIPGAPGTSRPTFRGLHFSTHFLLLMLEQTHLLSGRAVVELRFFGGGQPLLAGRARLFIQVVSATIRLLDDGLTSMFQPPTGLPGMTSGVVV